MAPSASHRLRVVTEEFPGGLVVQPEGDLDAASFESFRRTLIAAATVAGRACLVVDLENVRYLDSTGLGALVAGLKVEA